MWQFPFQVIKYRQSFPFVHAWLLEPERLDSSQVLDEVRSGVFFFNVLKNQECENQEKTTFKDNATQRCRKCVHVCFVYFYVFWFMDGIRISKLKIHLLLKLFLTFHSHSYFQNKCRQNDYTFDNNYSFVAGNTIWLDIEYCEFPIISLRWN